MDENKEKIIEIDVKVKVLKGAFWALVDVLTENGTLKKPDLEKLGEKIQKSL